MQKQKSLYFIICNYILFTLFLKKKKLYLALLGLHFYVGFVLLAEIKGYSLGGVCGLLIAGASLSVEHRLQGAQAQQLQLLGSRAQSPQLWHTGLAALQHVGSSHIRDQTHVSCIGRSILYHWATREAPIYT